jgi:hypothetical protein
MCLSGGDREPGRCRMDIKTSREVDTKMSWEVDVGMTRVEMPVELVALNGGTSPAQAGPHA